LRTGPCRFGFAKAASRSKRPVRRADRARKAYRTHILRTSWGRILKSILFMNSKFFLENFLNNSSFFFLLCSMSFYWICAFLNISSFSNIGKFTIISANLAMSFLLIYRGFLENHFPLSNPAIKKEYHFFYSKIVFAKI